MELRPGAAGDPATQPRAPSTFFAAPYDEEEHPRPTGPGTRPGQRPQVRVGHERRADGRLERGRRSGHGAVPVGVATAHPASSRVAGAPGTGIRNGYSRPASHRAPPPPPSPSNAWPRGRPRPRPLRTGFPPRPRRAGTSGAPAQRRLAASSRRAARRMPAGGPGGSADPIPSRSRRPEPPSGPRAHPTAGEAVRQGQPVARPADEEDAWGHPRAATRIRSSRE